MTIVKLSNSNSLTVDIEENFSNEYSVVVADEMGDYWIERTAKTIEAAKAIAAKLVAIILKNY